MLPLCRLFVDGKRSYYSFISVGVTNWKKKIKEMCSCKFVMFIIAILALVATIVGIIVSNVKH